MAHDELDRAYRAAEDDELADVESLGAAVGKATVSAVLATSLAGALSAPPRADLITLPEPTPIVQEYRVEEELPPHEEQQDDARTIRWRRMLQILKRLLVVLMLVATLLFGVLKGCAGLAMAPLLPQEDQQEQHSAQSAPAEDERGVAY